jgi:predicted amidohydrolase
MTEIVQGPVSGRGATTQARAASATQREVGPQHLDVGAVGSVGDDPLAVARIVGAAAAIGTHLIVLPELAGHPNGQVSPSIAGRPERAVATSDAVVRAIRDALQGTPTVAVTSVVDVFDGGFCHTGVVISADGISLKQRQINADPLHASWQNRFGEDVTYADMEWGRLAVMIGADLTDPQLTPTVARFETDVIAAAAHPGLGLDPTAAAQTLGLPVVYSARAQGTAEPLIASTTRNSDGSVVVVGHRAETGQPLVWGLITVGGHA